MREPQEDRRGLHHGHHGGGWVVVNVQVSPAAPGERPAINEVISNVSDSPTRVLVAGFGRSPYSGAVKLYVCRGTLTGATIRPFRRADAHPCGVAHEALKQAGHDPQVIRCFGWTELPAIFNMTPGRRKVKELTGDVTVPILVTDDEEVIAGSGESVAWAE